MSNKMRVLYVECPNEKCGFGVKFEHLNKTFYYCKKDRLGMNVSDAQLGKDQLCTACMHKLEQYRLASEDNICPICNEACLDVAYQSIDTTTEREQRLEKYTKRPKLSESDYLNPELFPLTTQDDPKLKYQDQIFINSFNWNELVRRMYEEGAGAGRESLEGIRELEIKFGASFIENVLSVIDEDSRPVSLFLTVGCKKCEGPGALRNGLCAYCDRREEIDTGKSDTGDWYRTFIQGGLAWK